MAEGVSKFAIAVEALVLLVPISILAFLMCVINLESILIGKSPTPDLLIVLPTVCLFCGWILVFRFFVYGSSALISSPNWIWFGAICGGLATIAALAITLGSNSLKTALPEYFGVLVVGSPALVPLIHQLLERALRKPDGIRLHDTGQVARVQ